MSDFFKKFLLEEARRFGPGGRYAALAAFGKHPGWDDHVEDLGLETESLNLAKTVFYVNGIGGQIDSGAWEKLEPAQQLPAFKHVFVWQRDGQFLIGRLWSSSDGKGRKRYPMVVCAHFMGVTLGWALKQALPALAELEERCLQTNSKEEVRSLLGRKRAALREAVQSSTDRGEYAPVTPEALHRILQPGGQSQSEGFLRVLYQMQGQLGTFGPGRFNARANPAAIRAQQIRVPVAGENPEQALLFWSRFFLTQVDASVPLLLTLPLEESWLDVTVGEPESHEFFCLRASPKSVPLVSEVPYKLDETFSTKATAFLQRFQRGETVSTDLRPAPAPVLDAPAPAKGGWLKWFGVVIFLALAGAATFLLLPKPGEQRAEIQPPQTNPVVAKPPVAEPTPVASEARQLPASPAKPAVDARNETARLAEEKKKADALAAAKQKADADAAAKLLEHQQKEKQLADAARIEKEQQLARQKELEEQQRKADEAAAAKAKVEQDAKAKPTPAATPASIASDSKPAVATAAPALPVTGEMTNSIGMVLVPLPSGIWVGKFEVTQAEYQKVMGSNPSKSINEGQPVERVSWNEAREFCRKLTELERGRLPAGRSYTLPTEQQWKDFLGGQKFEDLPGGGVTSKGSPALVGRSGRANKFGLFDVLGNVWEWCLDGATGDEKLLKGGAFNSANYDRTLLPDVQVSNCGFRCVLAAQ